MLRLGKRGSSSSLDEQEALQQLLDAYEREYGYYYPEDIEVSYPEELSRKRRSTEEENDESFHRSRRSAEVAPAPAGSDFSQQQIENVKRSVDDMPTPVEEEGEFLDDEIEKRPMNMLRLGKRPMNMLRLGKRPMNMLRLGKRPMNMLRLGKRPMNMLRLGKREGEEEEESFLDDDEYMPLEDEDESLSADKRPMNMLRLGKRPMNMLRLGKRPMNMLRLGKRPMNMLRLGKRPMNMLRLGKRPMNMLRLGKRPMNMLRLGKRPMNMLRLGKRAAE